MRRAALLALAVLPLLAAGMAGCLGGGSGDGDGRGNTTPTTTGPATGSGTSSTSGTSTGPSPSPPVLPLLSSFAFTACSGLQVVQQQPLADVQALLPAGFTARPAPGSAGSATGALAIDLFACGNLTTPTAAVPSTYFGMLYTYVERPVDRVPGAPDGALQEYAFRILAGEDVLAVLWPAAGYDTYNGSARVQVGPVAEPDLGVRAGSAEVGEDYTLVASGLAGVGGGRTESFARYTVLADGSVLVWTGTYAFPAAAGGAGTFEVDEEGPFAEFGAPPDRPFLRGEAHQYDAGDVLAQDLRRVFTPAT